MNALKNALKKDGAEGAQAPAHEGHAPPPPSDAPAPEKKKLGASLMEKAAEKARAIRENTTVVAAIAKAGEVRAAAKEKVAEKVQDFKDKQAERKAARDGTGKEAAEASDALSGLTIQSRVPQPRLLDIPSLAGFIERVAEVNGAGPEVVATFTPFLCAGKVIGYMKPAFAERLLTYKDIFQRGQGKTIELKPELDTPEARTSAMDKVTRDMQRAKLLPGWRNEMFPVVSRFGEEPLFLIERAAVAWFGIKAYGVHVNGYVKKDGETFLWVARRSASKPTFPGLLDHIVAGGQPYGISCFDNVVKEAEEEASIPELLASKAVACGALGYQSVSQEGLKRDVIFVYDLELPEEFVPKPKDGEVEEFFLLPIAQAAEVVRTTKEYKPNCAIVVIDFLLRHGYLAPEQGHYLTLVKALRGGEIV